MKIKLIVILFICMMITVITSGRITAQSKDSVRIFWLQPIEVTSQKVAIGEMNLSGEKDRLENLLSSGSFFLIRRGEFFAQDIYADGMKRGDINIIVDGERYHNACPNRMDTPLSRVNPIELESVDLIKTAGSLNSGLGGVVEFKRSTPGVPFRFKTDLNGSLGNSRNTDLSLLAEGKDQLISLRYATGEPYKDGSDRSFKDLYGYENNYNYTLAEFSFRGKQEDWNYGASFSYTNNVSFPYLLMDERLDHVYNAFIEFNKNKLYFNYTHHFMDNDLRVSPMYMQTDAKNFTIGVTGDSYEVYYRKWNADNFMRTNMGTMQVNNHMIPDINYLSGSYHRIFTFDKINISTKLGAVYQFIDDKQRLSFYQALYQDADTKRFFVPFGLSVSYNNTLTDKIGYGVLAEAAGEPPQSENLFIGVQRMMNNPVWVGNPALNEPLRGTVRASLNYDKLNLEGFVSMIWNYVNLTEALANNKKYQTYKNIDANIFGFNLTGNWQLFDFVASYTYAQNKTDDNPLAEIPPFKLITNVRTPVLQSTQLYLRGTYSAEQNRIDPLLNEKSTPSWYKVDAGAVYGFNKFLLSLEIENLTNQTYYQHLSYLRDPFSSGQQIFEPGRTIRLGIKYNTLF